MKKPDIIVALDMVIECFEKLGITYYIGGSEQQWKDVLGVLKVQDDKLDSEYLKHWASRLNLSDLLNHSFDDAGMTESA